MKVVPKENSVGRCSVEVYGKEIDGGYDFCDLRTIVDYDSLKKTDSYDFTKGETALDRLFNYKLTNAIFDLDYCSSMRNRYEFKPMSDLYEILWGIKDKRIINSSETLVSSNMNIVRCRPDIKRKPGGKAINWEYNYEQFRKGAFKDDDELKSFAKSVATIGNFMAVPAKHQSLLSSMEERYDRVLNLIKAFYFCYDLHISNDFIADELKEWLEQYREENGETSWKRFVDENYLKGSFVNEHYEVVEYNGKLAQLSDFIYARSVVMIQEYKRQLEQTESNNFL